MKPEAFLKRTQKMADNLKAMKKRAVFVGLPKDKVGGAIYGDGRSILANGAVHEYGGTFRHPGGTRYVIGSDGLARFVGHDYVGPVQGTTKPHSITIPQRSFLRVPFAMQRAELQKAIRTQYKAVSEGKKSVDAGLGIIGAVATNISKGSFTTQGYGTWDDIKPATKAAKGSGQPLIDTGLLRGSITSVVRDAS